MDKIFDVEISGGNMNDIANHLKKYKYLWNSLKEFLKYCYIDTPNKNVKEKQIYKDILSIMEVREEEA